MLLLDTPFDADMLCAWVQRQHRVGKHALVLTDGYDPVEVTASLLSLFGGAASTSAVDFMVSDKWVLVRPLLERIPSKLKSDPTMGVCVISP